MSNDLVKASEKLSYEDWFETYKPIKNELEADAPYDGCMFETYGEQLDFIRQRPESRIWTLVDCDGKLYVTSGYHFVNRMGYFITELPFTEEFMEIAVDDEID